MALVESLPGTFSTCASTAGSPSADGAGVIWMTGEHDIGTSAELAVAFARAMTRDDADVVVDLSEVAFMSASTAGLLARTRAALRLESRSLVLRAPSRSAARILGLCGLMDAAIV
jgi:anti-anti-sigma factor